MRFFTHPVRTASIAIQITLLCACATTPSPVASTYQSSFGCCGRFPSWLVPHSGVDFTGQFGEDVIAPADGVVIPHLGALFETCGNTVVLHHTKFKLYSVFCHFQDVSVKIGQSVKRGEKIGTLGDSGVAGDCRRAGRPCAIVHTELNSDGRGHPTALNGITFDVLEHSAGCFDSTAEYPADRLVLTHPVRCQGKVNKADLVLPHGDCVAEVGGLPEGGTAHASAIRHH